MTEQVISFRKIKFHPDNSGTKGMANHIYYKSPTSFRQISESKEKQKPMFGKLKQKRIQLSQTSSGKKSSNLFNKMLETCEPFCKKKLSLLDQTNVSTNENSVTTNNSSIIKQNNKQENNKIKGLRFKQFPHKKINNIYNRNKAKPKQEARSSISPHLRIKTQGQLIGSNKKKIMKGIQIERGNEIKGKQILMAKKFERPSTDRIFDDIDVMSSIQNSVIQSQSSLMFDMSPTLV